MIPIEAEEKETEVRNPQSADAAEAEDNVQEAAAEQENTEETAEETAESPEEAEAEEEKAEDKKKGKSFFKGKDKDKEKDKAPSKDEELAVLNDKYLRLCAEYDNFRKRTIKEKENIYSDVRTSVITDILPIYDNLARALAQPTEDEAYKKGVEMTMNQFNAILEKLGVTAIPAVGEKFDPSLHNAVMHCDDPEKGENEIAEEFQKGFKLGDKIIRFSMVKVAN